MIYREIGKTGLKASVIGFGGMRFFNHPEDLAIRTVRRALDLGVTFFETGAYGGGKSETMLGKGLKGHRQDVVLANKASVADLPDGVQVRKSLEASLEREQTDYFDVFSFWGTNNREIFDNLMRPGGPMDVVVKAKEQGLLRAIGITTHAQPEMIVEFLKEYPFDCVTLKEHMLFSRQTETIAYCRDKGIGVVVMSPLAGGVVADPSEDIRLEVEKAGMTPARLGLRFLTSNPGVTSAISGVESPEDVEDNVKAGATDGPLTVDERRLIDMIREKTSAIGENFCTQCGYCMPCPENINIPGTFRLWNILRGYGSDQYSRLEYMKLREERHWADIPGRSAEHCVECGECEAKCPNGLAIVEDLKKAHADLTAEGWDEKAQV